jgi:glycosyltransferase involved in cell wall biosynthesis
MLESEEGIVMHGLARMQGRGMNPLKDLACLAELIVLYRRLKPLAVLQYTIKPNIYGSIAARLSGVPAINNVTGLGELFTRDSFVQRLARILYSLAFSRAYRIFFQNADDYELFLRLRLANEVNSRRLPGSGVDTAFWAPVSRTGPRHFTFILAARLLKEKGIEDYADAARLAKGLRPDLRFLLAGDHDPLDAKMVAAASLEAWQRDGILEWLGMIADMRNAYAQADCVVLPTLYREGVPRSLLEAASMAKPLIASDSVGAREPVAEGVNGYLCKPGNPPDLARAMLAIASLPESDLAAMGAASRKKMQDEFEESVVLDAYVKALSGLQKN